MRTFVTSVLVFLSLMEFAKANEASMSVQMWVAFNCTAYAEHTDDRVEQQRLFRTRVPGGRHLHGGR